ncbi:hypothetical protein HISP_11640 [Haloarcula hispanica N601]|uniref:Uncharacterized protein n=3 Tax=Haloarcula hispanica TaxID=51589 RepID=A0A482T194_HALHI|nr:MULTISPECIES: hypothetical protein [Haloarcula]AEM57874.1 hypothetical protein HAH_2286 [Haloarcula hispanica ATCC 33960]AHB66623.1 hypothetical protein HISP_11640 [Haloarcula hispanica N601]AJF24930.1 hypothetical protein SG26_03990 [Haloarcula sp. CBA1115]KAA9410521.1 hypothetical protein EGO51_12150 [Haloarcula hispanica]KZX47587.1 hypothetical protein AV929_04410 [Haloarcula sp. K1]
MSTRTDGPDGFSGQYVEQLLPRQSPTRHDLVLAVIPAVFVLTLVAAVVLGLSMQVAIAGASVVGAVAVIDALFVHPPTRGRRRGDT